MLTTGMVWLLWGGMAGESAVSQALEVEKRDSEILVTRGGNPVATFVFRDGQVGRPFFAHVHSPAGHLVTRFFPPRKGIDSTDHETIHPGIWLSFSGISGKDYWRNRAKTSFARWVEEPWSRGEIAGWSAELAYDQGTLPPLRERCRWTIYSDQREYWILWDSAFQADQDVVFEDREEMGLGVRVATELAADRGGRIRNSFGQVGEKNVWGKPATWVDYSKEMEGDRRGVVLIPHPDQFRNSLFHARDYGLLAAHPFGMKSFTGSGDGSYRLNAGETLRLRYAVVAYDHGAKEVDWVDRYRVVEEISRR